MFKIGDYIVYGSEGVCQVAEIGKPRVGGMNSDRTYYTLVPLYSQGSRVFTPTDNTKVIMRPVLTREEAIQLIDDFKNIGQLWVDDDRNREEVYKEAIRRYDCREDVKIIKTLYLRKQSRLNEGKKVTAGDEKYLCMAEDNLYGELAVALGMKKDEIESFIASRVENSESGEEIMVDETIATTMDVEIK